MNILNVETRCPICGEYSIITVDKEDFLAWQKGTLLAQEAFPYLNVEDREMLISGICPDCWERMFPTEKWWSEEDEEEEETDWDGVFEALRNILKILEEKEEED